MKKPKSNTSSTKRRSTVKRAIDAIQKHLEAHPTDGQSKGHLAKLESKLKDVV